jgi:hypothetical protein
MEKKNLDLVLAETEQLLRSTFGYGVLQARADDRKARALLDATQHYARGLAQHPENATFADSTGFSPEGVRSALLTMRGLETKLSASDWQPASLFGPIRTSPLPALFGVMMQIPQLRNPLLELGARGLDKTRLAQLAQAWVSGAPIEKIATEYFDGSTENMTKAITAACKGVYRTLANAGTWGLAALSKMSDIDFDSLSPELRRSINNLPAMLYHGVSSEAGIAMRINSVPRSIAERLGERFAGAVTSEDLGHPQVAREFLVSLREADWDEARPTGATMSGADYRHVWARLSGEAIQG